MMSSAPFDRIRTGIASMARLQAGAGPVAPQRRSSGSSRAIVALLAGGAVAALAGCAVQPVPGQSSIMSRLPADFAYSAPVDTQPVQTQSLPQVQPQPQPQAQSQPPLQFQPQTQAQAQSQGQLQPEAPLQIAPDANAGTAADVPPMSAQERQRYADIDRQVQRDQTQAMAAEQAARNAWYYPSYGYPAYYPAYYPSYYPAYTPAYYPYYASPVVVGGYYGRGWGRGGCCWNGGSRWSVGIGYSTGWAW